MSKIRTNRLQSRSDNGTITIGNADEDGKTNYRHTTKIIGAVDIEGYASKEYVLNLISPGERPIDEFVLTEDAGRPAGYARLDADAQVQWTDMKDTIRDNHYDYRVDKSHKEIDSELASLNEGIVVLQGEIESIITLDEKGSWVSTPNDPPESGKVHFSSTSFNTSPMTVKISKLDDDGTNHTFATAGVGTWIEFVEDDQDYCLGQITSIDNDDDDFFLTTFDVSVSKGDTHKDSNVKIRLFEAADDFDPNSIRIVDIDDKPPVEPKEGDLWFDNNEEDMTLRVYQNESEAWIPVAPATTIEGRVATGEETQRAIQSTIDTALMDQAILRARPPGVRFWYQSGSSGLNDMHFQYYSGDTRLRISSKGADIDWLSEGFTTDYDMSNGPYFTIWYLPSITFVSDRPKWKVRKHGRISRIDWHSNNILCYISSQHSHGGFGEGASYYITIGGIL